MYSVTCSRVYSSFSDILVYPLVECVGYIDRSTNCLNSGLSIRGFLLAVTVGVAFAVDSGVLLAVMVGVALAVGFGVTLFGNILVWGG